MLKGPFIVHAEVFLNDMRYINSRFTYLLTYLLTCNGIFAKVCRLASEDVVVQLLRHQCLPILLYALEVCNLDRRAVQLLDFTLNRFLMKLFEKSNIEIVQRRQTAFGCELPRCMQLSKPYVEFIESLPTDN